MHFHLKSPSLCKNEANFRSARKSNNIDAAPSSIDDEMSRVTTLILKPANKICLGNIDWGPNNFDVVLSGDQCIGRIHARENLG